MTMRIPRNKLYVKTRTVLKALCMLLTPRALEGECLRNFEEEFAQFIGVKHAIALASGKLALQLCLEALGAKEGDKVILSDFNVPEVPALLACCGLVPVLLDIDPETFNINPDLIERHIDDKTKFILVTHMFGIPADMDKIVDLAKKHRLKIIEDACQATGSEYRGKRVGGFGDAAYFSFGTLKVFSTLNGGMAVTDQDTVAEHIRSEVKGYPLPGRFVLLKEIFKSIFIMIFTHPRVFNCLTFPLLTLINRCSENAKLGFLRGKEISRIEKRELLSLKKKYSNLQAQMGLDNLRDFPAHLSEFSGKVEMLDAMLRDSEVVFQARPSGVRGLYFKYVIRTKDRKELLRRLFRRGIDTTYGYMTACSTINDLNGFAARCPESQKLMNEHIYLPIHSIRSHEQIQYLADAMKGGS